MDGLVNLIKRKGYHDTFKILAFSDDYEISKKDFHKELNDFSNYNSYSRIKNKLIDLDLIQETENNGVSKIKGTDKGIFLYERLIEISNIL